MNNQVQHGDGVAAILCGIYLGIETGHCSCGVVKDILASLTDILRNRVSVF